MIRILLILLASFLLSCSPEMVPNKRPQGNLFIIGGGKRPPSLIADLIALSGLDTAGYVYILPMASGEPESAAYYGRRQFEEQGISSDRLHTWPGKPNSSTLDSLKQARLIYLTGGDQLRFMEKVKETKLPEAIRTAYQAGGTIAGTSAGAAVMSRLMITGDEKKHPEYTGDFRTIEADNLILAEGLGLLPNTIIDQHFVYRMRMNRLMAVALEYPDQTCIGIDESTALVVTPQFSRVGGKGQIIVLRNPSDSVAVRNGLLGGKRLFLDVLLPGDTLYLAR